MAAKTITIHGAKLRTASQRRFIVVIGREHDTEGRRVVGVSGGQAIYETTGEVFPAFPPRIAKRSDSLSTARREAAKLLNRRVVGCYVAVVDTTTGEEV